MKATHEQRGCLDLFNEGESLLVEAAAGSGKTTLLRYLIHRGHLYGKALYTSFGKKNIEEAKAKFPKERIDVRTNHSLAFRGFGSTWKSEGRLDGRLTPGSLASFMGWSDQTFSPYANERVGAHMVLATVERFAQSSADAILREHAFPGVATRVRDRQMLGPYTDRIVMLARSVWERMMARRDRLPITHDVYLKAFALTRPQLGYKHILLDEAQDSTDLIIGLLSAQEDCQLVIVGDRYQQIYAFRGAVNAMDRFETTNTASLTQSFRFGHQIAMIANAVLEKFLESSMKLKGLPSIASTIGPIERPFCVLARTNASLVGELVGRSMAEPNARLAVVGGVEDLENLIRGAESLMRNERTWVPDLAEFSSWPEVIKASDEDAYKYLKPLVEMVESYGPPVLRQVLARVRGNELDESSCSQVFSTVHKAKGREFPTVSLCDDFVDCPATQEEKVRTGWNPEEGNLLYVAVTRAQMRLDVSNCTAALHALASFAGDELSTAF